MLVAVLLLATPRGRSICYKGYLDLSLPPFDQSDESWVQSGNASYRSKRAIPLLEEPQGTSTRKIRVTSLVEVKGEVLQGTRLS